MLRSCKIYLTGSDCKRIASFWVIVHAGVYSYTMDCAITKSSLGDICTKCSMTVTHGMGFWNVTLFTIKQKHQSLRWILTQYINKNELKKIALQVFEN